MGCELTYRVCRTIYEMRSHQSRSRLDPRVRWIDCHKAAHDGLARNNFVTTITGPMRSRMACTQSSPSVRLCDIRFGPRSSSEFVRTHAAGGRSILDPRATSGLACYHMRTNYEKHRNWSAHYQLCQTVRPDRVKSVRRRI